MEKIGFIGAFDKTDLLIQTAKILAVIGKKVIVIDSSISQKAKYIIPVINPTTSYITEFEGFDVAVGFNDFDGIERFIGIGENDKLEYDIALFDIDSYKAFEEFGMQDAKINYFVTSFDLFSLKKGLEIIDGINQAVLLKKVLFTKTMSKEEDDYLNFLSQNLPIVWDDVKIFFPFEMGDQSVIIEGQRVSKIKFKNLSNGYKDSLLFIVEEITGKSHTELKRIIKNIEKS